MNPLGATLTFICILLVTKMPRPGAALAVIAATCYITQGQVINTGVFHFTAIRLVVLFGIFRVIARGELAQMEMNIMDKTLLAYVASTCIITVIRTGMDFGEMVYQLGSSYNILLPYFLFRCLIQNLNDLQEFLAGLAVLIIPFAIMLVFESRNGHNFFSLMGGVYPVDMYRDGHYRCSGAFRSPITGGTFGATFMPFFLGLYFVSERRRAAIIGALAATCIVICARSSGPLLAYGSAILGFAFWKWREHMRTVRWAILITIVSLHMVMKAPVWFLLARVSDVVGGGGWHRAYLVDQAVRHFGSWWLFGTQDTGDWMPTQLADGAADLTNQFVAAGVRGGLISLVIFVLLIVRCYQNLGLAMQKVRGGDSEVEMQLWMVGAALFATIVNFFSVSYFDQIDVIWYLLLAVIASVSMATLNEEPGRFTTADENGGEQPNFVGQPS